MIEVVLNEILPDGMKHIRVMAGEAVTNADLLRYVPGAARPLARMKCERLASLSLFYGDVVYPLREVVECHVACGVGRARKLAVWKMVPEEGYRVSEIVAFLADWYFQQTHHRPEFAFMKKLPTGAESGCEVDGVMLFEAEWAMSGCVMVGG